MTTGMTVAPLPKEVTPYPVIANIEFAEGPIFDDQGNLYFVNYLKNGTLGRMTPDGSTSIWVHTGGQVNGLKYDGQGWIVAADPGRKRITRFHTQTREMQVLTDSFEGKPYIGTNDVCLDLKGNVFFSDPGNDEDKPVGGVYRIEMGPDNKPVRVTQLDGELPYPNGLAVHPDQKRFYVATSGDMSILGYDLTEEGRLANKRLIYKFPTYTVDGIMFDEHGRLWVARWLHGTIDVLDVDEGKVLASYKMGGDRVTNLCFWGTSAYVTVAGRHSIERLDVGVRGARIVPKR